MAVSRGLVLHPTKTEPTGDVFARWITRAAASFSILLVALVVFFLALNAYPFVRDVGFGQFFGSANWQPDADIAFGHSTFGAWAPILGSLATVFLALVIAVPLAFAVALFLEETDPIIGRRWLRPAVEVLVGIPSVVYGYLGFIALLPLLRPLAPSGDVGSGILAAALVLSLMIVPTIATLSADGLRSVPAELKEGSLALGATQWQTIRRVLLPAAKVGLVSGIVLGLARAMGEALAVSMVIGDVNVVPSATKHGIQALLQPFTTMTVAITDGLNTLAINPHGTGARYLLALILLLMTFAAVSTVRAVAARSGAK